ncbi:MAG: hypothetical protein KJS92_01915, partial [Bacteroidetes bacterium]|nr:hypothetical protein [Bacteroidota bacterium]
MKKVLLLLSALAAVTSGSYAQPCGDGVNTVKTFTPAGTSFADRLWNTATNWSPAGVPDCDDDVRIWNGIAYVTANVTVRDIRVFRQTTPVAGVGVLRIEGNYTVTCRNMVLDEGNMESNTTAYSAIVADSVSLAKNAQMTVRYLTVKRRIAQGNSKVNMMEYGIADLKHVVLNDYATFTAPSGWQKNNKSRVDVRGDFFIAELAKYVHNNGTLRFIDTGRNMINTAGTSGKIREFWNIEIEKKLDGAGDITEPGRLRTPF